MALYLPETKTLFIHIPKCGGHWVEAVLKACNIPHRRANSKCGLPVLHGRVQDYDEDVDSSFCMLRDLQDWKYSYWRYHLPATKELWEQAKATGSPELHLQYTGLQPPLPGWNHWSRRGSHFTLESQEYLAKMKEGVDHTLEMNASSLHSHLKSVLGYDVSMEDVTSVNAVNQTQLKVELGGGGLSVGNNYVNVDIDHRANLQHDLNSIPYPFPDDSVDAVYSSHCLEHLSDPNRSFQEIARICRVGAQVVIKVPHENASMAMCAGHVSTISEQQIINMCHHFYQDFFPGKKYLYHVSTDLDPSEGLLRMKRELPMLSIADDQALMRWIPGTCHQSIFTLEVREK